MSRVHHCGVALLCLVLYSALFIGLGAVGAVPPSHVLFPFLGTFISWTLTVWLGYAVLLGLLAFLSWLVSGRRRTAEEATFGPMLPSMWGRRTGIAGTEKLTLVIFAVLSLVFWNNAAWFPLLTLWTVVMLVVILAVPVEKWPLRRSRDIPPPDSIDLPDTAEDLVKREWNWSSMSRNLPAKVRVGIRKSVYLSRQAANPSHGGITDSSISQVVRDLVDGGSEDREAKEAARQLLAFAREHRFNYFEEAQNTLQFVQIIPYSTDQESKHMEYFRYAIETFYDNTADCDCKAIAAATMFRLMGLRSVVLLSGEEGHAAVAVEGTPDFVGNYFRWKDRSFYFCETTANGMRVGELPPDVDLSRYVRIEIEPRLFSA